MILVVNMMDAVKQRGIKSMLIFLSSFWVARVIPITLRPGRYRHIEGGDQQSGYHQADTFGKISYIAGTEQAINDISPLLIETAQQHQCDLRWLAVRLLEDDTLAKQFAGAALLPTVAHYNAGRSPTDDEIDILAADARYGFVNELAGGSVCKFK